MNRNESRGPWYLLTGLIIGLLFGIGYTRFFQPVKYVDTSPASLRQDYKDRYRALIASAYLANGDLIRASARLDLLEDSDKFRALTEQAQRTLAKDSGSKDARAIGLLAIALGQEPPGPGQAITQPPKIPTITSIISTPAELSPQISETSGPEQFQSSPVPLTPTPSDLMVNVPTSSLEPESFVLLNMTENCEQKLSDPLIIIETYNREGNPVPGVLVVVTWAGGEERFYTGLKPEKGPGYADFTLSPGFVYNLRIGENGAPLGNLEPITCKTSDGETFWGSIYIKYGLP